MLVGFFVRGDSSSREVEPETTEYREEVDWERLEDRVNRDMLDDGWCWEVLGVVKEHKAQKPPWF